MIITDGNFIYALFNQRDTHHHAALELANSERRRFITPDIVLPEVAYLINRDIGYSGIVTFLARYQEFHLQLQPVLDADISRMYEIATTYADARFDIVDYCIMALCEKLDVRTVATFDHRDFSMFRPAHCEVLALKP